MMPALASTSGTIHTRSLLAYGLFGLPLALVALPLYVYVPQLYAERFGMSLSLIGAALLAARLLDAFVDPAIGWWVDRSKNSGGYDRAVLLAVPLLAGGFLALFLPPALAEAQPLAWFLAALLLTYGGFSLASIAHQSWGAALTQAPGERARLTATREACGLVGVMLAAGIQQVLNPGWLSLVFVVTLVGAAALLLKVAARPAIETRPEQHGGLRALLVPFQGRRFRWLFAVFLVNGIAAAIPATLFLFFAKDHLQLADYSAAFLLLYFVAAALSMPLWVFAARRLGEARAWLLGMLLAVVAFVWAYGLGAGDAAAFGAICFLSGLTLGADLALPPALLAAVIGKAGHSGQREGAYFGVWNWATKLNLALAAGISLPLLEGLGYVPGTSGADSTEALRIAYALVPCALKLIAAAILLRAPLRDL